MSLYPNQPAPDFQIDDIEGNPVRLSAFKGQKVLLTFYRHVGCPFTNLRFLELREREKEFKKNGLVVLAVYESSIENLMRYCLKVPSYAKIIANPEFNLYQLYDIELNDLKILYSMYRGAYNKLMEGKKAFKDKFEPEGHANLLGGDFLINEEGIVVYPYYNQFLGDHLPVKDIEHFIHNEPLKAEIFSC
jgi:peroxiredoxin